MYTVKEIADILNMTEHSVRYYSDMGLIPSLKRNSNGNRIFDEESKNWLIGIKNLRGSGMSIKSIKEYVDLCLQGDSTVEKRYEIILEQKKQLEEKLNEMNEQYQYIEKKSKLYMDIMNKGIQDISNPALWKINDSEAEKEKCKL
ncbi:MerR family transcriptional regulator [Clostridium butyricum]|uniref:MerR family transcriptional regulator n=1 Tax=Clostridium butyricum TaxID=1492 RepID=UPI00374E3B65